jgi:DNA modification methylase
LPLPYRKLVSFEDYGITLMLGDSLEIMTAMVNDPLNDVEADQVLCDPPYGISYQGMKHRKIANDSSAEDISLAAVPLLAELLKTDGAMYICSREDVANWWWHAMTDAKINIKSSVIWNKCQWTMGDSASDMRRQTEMILIGHKGRALLQPWTWGDLPSWFVGTGAKKDRVWADGERDKLVKRDTVLWTYPVPRDAESQRHPTPKPPEIMERAMVNHSRRGELILDPFMGGGPVGVAAVRQGRRYMGIELEADYFEIAVENISKAIELLKSNHAPEDI